jgi:hypothetical protein
MRVLLIVLIILIFISLKGNYIPINITNNPLLPLTNPVIDQNWGDIIAYSPTLNMWASLRLLEGNLNGTFASSAYSTDGINWVQVLPGLNNLQPQSWTKLEWGYDQNGVGMFYAGGKPPVTSIFGQTTQVPTSLAYSYDGIHWQSNQSLSVPMTACAFGAVATRPYGNWLSNENGIFYNVGADGGFSYSTDLINWSIDTPWDPNMPTPYVNGYGNGCLVPNGTSVPIEDSQLYNGTIFVVSLYNVYYRKASAMNTQWSSFSLVTAPVAHQRIRYINGDYIITVLNTQILGAPTIYVSTDLVNWTGYSPKDGIGNDVKNIFDIKYFNNKYVLTSGQSISIAKNLSDAIYDYVEQPLTQVVPDTMWWTKILWRYWFKPTLMAASSSRLVIMSTTNMSNWTEHAWFGSLGSSWGPGTGVDTRLGSLSTTDLDNWDAGN